MIIMTQSYNTIAVFTVNMDFPFHRPTGHYIIYYISKQTLRITLLITLIITVNYNTLVLLSNLRSLIRGRKEEFFFLFL